MKNLPTSEYKVPFVNYSQNYLNIELEIDEAIRKCLTGGKLILQEEVEKFEENLAKYLGVKYAIGVNSGTDAIMLALKATGIKPGDEVLVPYYTFWATWEAVYNIGAKPVTEISDKTKAIIPVHMEGEIDNMNIVRNDNLIVIEDACQALGASFNNQKAGTIGLAGCFSFYPAKVLGAYGDAGAVVTNDKEIAENVRNLRNHGNKGELFGGYNSRMDNIQAAILNVKINYLNHYIERRAEIAKIYDMELPKTNMILPHKSPGRIYQDYVIETVYRDKLYNFLKEKGIETMKNEYHFPKEANKKISIRESIGLRLPICPETTDKQVYLVVDEILNFLFPIYDKK